LHFPVAVRGEAHPPPRGLPLAAPAPRPRVQLDGMYSARRRLARRCRLAADLHRDQPGIARLVLHEDLVMRCRWALGLVLVFPLVAGVPDASSRRSVERPPSMMSSTGCRTDREPPLHAIGQRVERDERRRDGEGAPPAPRPGRAPSPSDAVRPPARPATNGVEVGFAIVRHRSGHIVPGGAFNGIFGGRRPAAGHEVEYKDKTKRPSTRSPRSRAGQVEQVPGDPVKSRQGRTYVATPGDEPLYMASSDDA